MYAGAARHAACSLALHTKRRISGRAALLSCTSWTPICALTWALSVWSASSFDSSSPRAVCLRPAHTYWSEWHMATRRGSQHCITCSTWAVGAGQYLHELPSQGLTGRPQAAELLGVEGRLAVAAQPPGQLVDAQPAILHRPGYRLRDLRSTSSLTRAQADGCFTAAHGAQETPCHRSQARLAAPRPLAARSRAERAAVAIVARLSSQRGEGLVSGVRRAVRR